MFTDTSLSSRGSYLILPSKVENSGALRGLCFFLFLLSTGGLASVLVARTFFLSQVFKMIYLQVKGPTYELFRSSRRNDVEKCNKPNFFAGFEYSLTLIREKNRLTPWAGKKAWIGYFFSQWNPKSLMVFRNVLSATFRDI